MTIAVSAWDELRSGVQAGVLAGFAAHFGRLAWNSDQIFAEQRDGLTKLLSYASEHSPFHAGRLRGIDVDAVDPHDIDRFGGSEHLLANVNTRAELEQLETLAAHNP